MKNLKGQILVILMIALAIVSIILISVSRNARKDTSSQVQSEQYEEYYSTVEQELLKIVSDTNTVPNSCTMESLVTGECIIPVVLGAMESQSIPDAEGTPKKNANLRVVRQDVLNFSNFVIDKDKSLTINLSNEAKGYDGNIKFSWKGEVSWIVNLDYKSSAGEYKTSQSVYDVSNLFESSTSGLCKFHTDEENTFYFSINSCIPTSEVSPEILSLRLKPVSKDTSVIAELSLLEPKSGIPNQVTIITATAELENPQPDSPSIQLEMQIPLQNPSFEILDYALRTNKTVYKRRN